MDGTSSQLQDPSLSKTQCLVGGVWVDSLSKETFPVTDPATGAITNNYADFTPEDTVAAIEAAAAALPSFSRTGSRIRARFLRRWFDLVVSNTDDLAKLITLENGKVQAEAKGEVAYAASFLEWFSEEAPRVTGATLQASNPTSRAMTIRQPIGVCALIAPWNFPAAMITRKVAPALAAGCTVVIKAPPEAPGVALAIAELGLRAGLPPGVVNVVTTASHTQEVGRALTTHPLVRKVSFTGSTAVGRLLMAQSAAGIKKISFELGGNAPFAVFADADLDKAAAALAACKFRNSGQTCVCANRVLVQSSVHDAFVAKVVERLRPLKIGSGFDPEVTHGPLIHERGVNKVKSIVQDAVSKGAQVFWQGDLSLGTGCKSACFYPITVLTGMRSDMLVSSDEIFGPVIAVYKFETEQEAISLANDSDVGLAGYFFSKDVQRCWRMAEALEVGMVGINTGVISDPQLPFGGIKQSGFGKEGSIYGIEEYLVTKLVVTGDIE
ncbi:succinic semialdehyde dehydrogenase [Pleurostoma richardsiae]|uniref:Succinate-semialdehyde dehydrogenase, mitochondrial n=1 Tax=Pleurostoma richardsiae TaxID=41990 RepID=A0AA38RR43_9PEZI|nr:succinic semialdehyde dehydrogenase [Pleurostoma richardsiae]